LPLIPLGEPFQSIVRVLVVVVIVLIVLWIIADLIGVMGVHIPWYSRY